jgi:hypothetical protein
LTALESSRAQTTEIPVGVKVGDEFVFASQMSLSPGVSLNNLSSDESNFYLEYSNLDWIKLRINYISENNGSISYEMLYHFANGTETTNGYFIGSSYLDVAGADPFFYHSGLSNGELYPFAQVNDYNHYRSCQTTSKTYAESPRETNSISYTSSVSRGGFHVDVQTGALVDFNVSMNRQLLGKQLVGIANPDITEKVIVNWDLELIESSLWVVSANITPSPSVPEYSTSVIVPLFMGSLVGILSYKAIARKNHGK